MRGQVCSGPSVAPSHVQEPLVHARASPLCPSVDPSSPPTSGDSRIAESHPSRSGSGTTRTELLSSYYSSIRGHHTIVYETVPSNETTALAERIADSIREQLDDDSSSRRSFLGRSALAGGTLLALGGGTGVAVAQDDEDGDTGKGTTAMFDDVEGTDIDVLNYALTLENLENAFYRQDLERFDRDDFNSAEIVRDYSPEGVSSVYSALETIGDHEAAHVDTLTQAVTLLGGDPAAEASYDFGIGSVEDFLAVGQVLENTGVAAYAGAGTFIESPDLQSAALSIHSVEARHAAFLNDLNGETPFPNAFDPAKSQEEVLDAAGQFID